MLTEQEKQIAWDAWLTMAREHLSVFGNDPHGDGAKCLYAIVEAVLAQRTDGVRNDLIREAQIDAQIDRQRQRASISVPQKAGSSHVTSTALTLLCSAAGFRGFGVKHHAIRSVAFASAYSPVV